MESVQDRNIRIAKRLKHERTTNYFGTNEIERDKETGENIPVKGCKWFLCNREPENYKLIKQGLSQDEFAASIYYSKPTIVKWEKENGDNKIPSYDQIFKLCEFYDCDMTYLLCFQNERNIDYPEIQAFLGLDNKAVSVIRKASIINNAHYIRGFDINSEIEKGNCSIKDLEVESIEKEIIKLGLINQFITQCDDIANSIRSIEKAKEEQYSLGSYKNKQEIKEIFNNIYYTNLSSYTKWKQFSEKALTLYQLANDSTDKELTLEFLYTVWEQLVDEAEQRTVPQHRYNISESFNKIIDGLLSE